MKSAVPNGPCFFADGTHADHGLGARRITALTLDEDGNPVAEQSSPSSIRSQGYPDGMTVDAEDHVWIAFWDGWCLRRLSRTGQIVAEIALPVQRPTCPRLRWRGLDRLYITSATTGLSAEQRCRQPLAGGLLRLDPGVRPARASQSASADELTAAPRTPQRIEQHVELARRRQQERELQAEAVGQPALHDDQRAAGDRHDQQTRSPPRSAAPGRGCPA